MKREPHIECAPARGLLNLALIAAEDAATIAAFPPADEAGADVSQLGRRLINAEPQSH